MVPLRARATLERLDLVFGECSGAHAPNGKSHAAKLRNLARELHLGDDRVWTLAGDPAATLPVFAAKQHSDVLVLGALVGMLTRKLMNTLDCDFLLLRPGRFEFPVRGPREKVWAAGIRRGSYSSESLRGHVI